MQPNPHLLSIQIGTVMQYGTANASDPHDREWRTAFFKTPVAGPVEVNSQGILGDEQADRENHGARDKAVLLYAAEHYALWQQELNLPAMPCGGFGENFTITALDESNVCVGDTWSLGNVVLQVSQPRQPCWKLARRWRMKELPALVIENHRSGWYCRVLQPGQIAIGQELTLLARPHAEWTIARASDVMYREKNNIPLSHALAALPELAKSWQAELASR